MRRPELTIEMMQAFNALEVEAVESRASIARLTRERDEARTKLDQVRALVSDATGEHHRYVRPCGCFACRVAEVLR